MSDGLLPFERSFQGWMEKQGMRWVEGRLTTCRGGRPGRSYCLHPSTTPQRAVVALHGAGNDALFGWVGLFKELLRGGTLVYTFDLPGHGRGGDSRLDVDLVREAIAGAVSEAARLIGKRPVHAVGVSLGGSLLLDSLPSIGKRLTSAALVVAPSRIHLSPQTVLPEISPRSFALLWREREHYGLGGLFPSFGPFKREVYPLRLGSPPGPGMFGYVDAINAMIEGLDLENAAARTRLPVLLAYGESDRVVPIRQGETFSAALPNASLLRVRGGTHLSTPLSAEFRRALPAWMQKWE